MLENYPLMQVIISLIILLLMGYVGYNIFLIELQNMFKGENDIRKEISILNGTYDFSNSEVKYNTLDKTQSNFKDINPSINQEGGAEYSYNYWLFIDQDKLVKIGDGKKDIILFLKGEKILYYNNKTNYNCSNANSINNPVIITKNPLVRLSGDGKRIAVEYNNIYNTESYQQGSSYKSCNRSSSLSNDKSSLSNEWNNRNKNMLGIYDIDFNSKWFMITIVMKEVSDSNNVLSINKASCKMYVNGVKLLDKKVETKYNSKIYSATFKNNSSPFYINPRIDYKTPYENVTVGSVLKISDIKYYNYSINDEMISSLYNKGFNNNVADTTPVNKLSKYSIVSVDDMESNKIKEL